MLFLWERSSGNEHHKLEHMGKGEGSERGHRKNFFRNSEKRLEIRASEMPLPVWLSVVSA